MVRRRVEDEVRRREEEEGCGEEEIFKGTVV